MQMCHAVLTMASSLGPYLLQDGFFLLLLLMGIKLTVMFNLQVPFEQKEQKYKRNEVKRIESLRSSTPCLFWLFRL